MRLNVRAIAFGAGFAACVFLPFSAARNEEPGSSVVAVSDIAHYEDDRPAARYRLNAHDRGVVLRHGANGARWDVNGARDVWVFSSGDTVFLHYDAESSEGWLSSLATSKDLVTFTKKGPLLKLGPPGALDSASASYGTTYFDGSTWRMFYLGTQTTSPAPAKVPMGPYFTLRAKSKSPGGPWMKQGGVVLEPKDGTYYNISTSPGFIVKKGDEYLQFFSAGMRKKFGVARTIGIARTRNLDGPWVIDQQPIVPSAEQIENTSLYFQKSTQTWFLFTNHIALYNHQEYADAIWVYWSQDLEHWNPDNKAIVLDGSSSSWSKTVIGLPSVLPMNGRLAIFYDGLEPAAERLGAAAEHTDAYKHMLRDIGMAWLDLPIRLPGKDDAGMHRR
jgi:predicted GH43/DUF377 family glycosyl hydrolase